MVRAHLLVIALDLDLLRSLTFALEVEGYAVAAYTTLQAVPEHLAGYQCTIVSNDAIPASHDAFNQFCRRAAPVILLTDGITSDPGGSVAQSLILPMAGSALVDAIAHVIANSPVRARTK